MRMEQYLTHTDYALWEVIMNGDAPAIASASTEGPIPPKTAEQRLARKNELKAKSTLLLAIPDEHLLKFHGIKDAKTLWEAIKTRSEGLDKTYDRFQKLISQLEIHGEVISQEDVNLKLLRRCYSSSNEAFNTAYDVHAAMSKGQASSSTYADDSHFARECMAPKKSQGIEMEITSKKDYTSGDSCKCLGSSSSSEFRRLESLEARIVIHQKNDVYEEDIAFLKYEVQVKDISVKDLKNQLEERFK
ncbi:hypothetical protein Tco_0353566 [Tanacetum coccineum]